MKAIRYHSTSHQDYLAMRNAAILGLIIGAIAWAIVYKGILS